MKKIFLTFLLIATILIPTKAEVCDLSSFDKDEIKTLFKRANSPKVLVISDHIFDKTYSDFLIDDAAINKIYECFQKLGIPYVSYNGTRELMNGYGLSQSYEDIAMKANTTFYIKVNLTKNDIEKKKGGYFSSVIITLDAFDTENGMGIGSTSASSGIVGSIASQTEANFQAAREVACKGSQEIIPQITENIKNCLENGCFYEIRLYGARDYLIANEFKEVLTSFEEFTGEIRESNTGTYFRYEISYKTKRADLIKAKIMNESIKKPNLRKLDTCKDPGKLINFCLPW